MWLCLNYSILKAAFYDAEIKKAAAINLVTVIIESGVIR